MIRSCVFRVLSIVRDWYPELAAKSVETVYFLYA